jgi:hypothetical protein
MLLEPIDGVSGLDRKPTAKLIGVELPEAGPPGLVAHLRFLSVAVQGRYPQVKDWNTFLPAKRRASRSGPAGPIARPQED